MRGYVFLGFGLGLPLRLSVAGPVDFGVHRGRIKNEAAEFSSSMNSGSAAGPLAETEKLIIPASALTIPTLVVGLDAAVECDREGPGSA
jgi:hypothetical protein